MLSKTYAKYIQTLYHKKFREAENAFIAEGGKVVLELLHSKVFTCHNILGLESWLIENEAAIRKQYSGPLQQVSAIELEKISSLSTPNQVLAVFSKAKPVAIHTKEKLSLVLDNIQDPGNLGTIIRIADWFGITNIICSEKTAEMYNPKVVQSTMGSLGRVSVLYTDLEKWLLHHNDIKILAATLNGKNIYECVPTKEAILIVGNESKGISNQLLALANEQLSIPKIGQAESLNAAVATGILLSRLV
jgi:RNA methyltransferase, TrmH family